MRACVCVCDVLALLMQNFSQPGRFAGLLDEEEEGKGAGSQPPNQVTNES